MSGVLYSVYVGPPGVNHEGCKMSDPKGEKESQKASENGANGWIHAVVSATSGSSSSIKHQ